MSGINETELVKMRSALDKLNEKRAKYVVNGQTSNDAMLAGRVNLLQFYTELEDRKSNTATITQVKALLASHRNKDKIRSNASPSDVHGHRKRKKQSTSALSTADLSGARKFIDSKCSHDYYY
uniref:Uncharacterized protein n=1 Tax=Lygus hesperus TaxID=30085 RepID=A0A0A9ZAH2_LYGHE